MGERKNQLFQLCFNGSLRVDFQGSRVGLILIRELEGPAPFAVDPTGQEG